MQAQSSHQDKIVITTTHYGWGFKAYCSCGEYESPQRGFKGNAQACATQHVKKKHPDATLYYA